MRSEREEVTLLVLAILDRTTVAEQRRRAVRDRVDAALADPGTAKIVGLILTARRTRAGAGPNVIEIRR